MLVVNNFAGPGSGKSTIAAELFVYLKKQQVNAELVTEYAKDLCYEDRRCVLSDQLYILAKQNRKLARLKDKHIQVAITDSPILMQHVYADPNDIALHNMIDAVYSSYLNLNFFIHRNNELEFKTEGRLHNYEQACALDNKILNVFNDYYNNWQKQRSLPEDNPAKTYIVNPLVDVYVKTYKIEDIASQIMNYLCYIVD